MTDKEALLAFKLGIRPGPNAKAQLCRKLRVLYRKHGNYPKLRAWLLVEHQFPVSREWLTQRIGTTPKRPKDNSHASAA